LAPRASARLVGVPDEVWLTRLVGLLEVAQLVGEHGPQLPDG